MSDREWFVPEVDIEGLRPRVLAYDLDERVDEPSTLTLEVVLDDQAPPAPAEVLDRKIAFALRASDGSEERFFGGVVLEATRRQDPDGVLVLVVVARSALALLGMRRDCRTFQQKSVKDIVAQVLEPAGLSTVTWNVAASLEPRDWVVQYRETDLDFVRRLCSEEGIWFVLRSVDGGDEEIVFHDDPAGAGALDGDDFLFRSGFGPEGLGRNVLRVTRTEEVASDRVTTRDYDPEAPSLKIEGEAESADDGEHALEIYEWPARQVDEGGAKRRAKVLLEEVQGRRDRVEAEVTSVAPLPGHQVKLDGHPWEAANGTVTVIATRVAGAVPRAFAAEGATRVARFASSLVGLPSPKVALRPERRVRQARIVGAQSAFTTGAGGEEIHVDEAGRVKVRFHWDRSGATDDTSSHWFRTSQVPLGGSMLLPRVGWEVNLRFLDGDPDRPLVMGRLYDAERPPPYALPGDAARSALQTATSPGGGSSNEMRMTDSAGSEEVFFNASKDMTIEVLNNATEVVGNDLRKKVGADQTRSVTNSSRETVGANQTIAVGGDQKVHVETFMVEDVGGDHVLDVGGNRDMKIGGDHKRDVTGSSSLEVGSNQIDLVVGAVTDHAVGNFDHTVGTALAELCVGDRVHTVQGSRTEKTGALKVIATTGSRGVEVAGTMSQRVAGAIIHKIDGGRTEVSGATFTEVAAGAHVVKAENITIEGETMVSLVMGASTITLLPAVVAIAGVSVKLDGDVADTAALILDN